jgi:SAM-dependent methyltransferase
MAIPQECPLCGRPSDEQNVITRHVYGGKPGQAFFRCERCDVSYLFPRLSPEEEKRFYAAEFSNFMSGRAGTAAGWEEPAKHVQANAWMVSRRMKYLASRLPAKGKVLEVGCSSAFMLYPMVERGLECVGVEPSGVFAEYVRSRGINCYDSVEDLVAAGQYRDGFDLIFHAFVLEHISTPVAFLQQQLDLLKPGGQLIFEIPNSADALLTIYDIPAFERFYWIVAHAWYFSQRALEYLLGTLNLPYEILLDQRYDLSNHLVWARDGRPGGMGRFTPKFGQELEDQYRQALVASGHCDTLVGIITKR